MCGRIEEVDTHVNTLFLQVDDCGATIQQGIITLQAMTSNPTNPSIPYVPTMPSTSQRPASHYDVLSQLGKSPTQISILELLTTSPIHKEILETALLECHVLENINASHFTTMIENLAAKKHVIFIDKDFQGPSQHHNFSLHIEVLIQ